MPPSLHLLLRPAPGGGTRAELTADPDVISRLDLSWLQVNAARVPVILRIQADLLGSAVVRLVQGSLACSDGRQPASPAVVAQSSVGAVLFTVHEDQAGRVTLDVAVSPPAG